jgi:N-acetylmuramoyl-L-alanine amidase
LVEILLALYGYNAAPSGVFDEGTEAVVASFQRHFRPERVDVVADESTLITLRNLLAARPFSRHA